MENQLKAHKNLILIGLVILVFSITFSFKYYGIPSGFKNVTIGNLLYYRGIQLSSLMLTLGLLGDELDTFRRNIYFTCLVGLIVLITTSNYNLFVCDTCISVKEYCRRPLKACMIIIFIISILKFIKINNLNTKSKYLKL
jgi:hypothetical protein